MCQPGGAFRFRSQRLLFGVAQHGCSLSAERSPGRGFASAVFLQPFGCFQLPGMFQQPTEEPQHGGAVGANHRETGRSQSPLWQTVVCPRGQSAASQSHEQKWDGSKWVCTVASSGGILGPGGFSMWTLHVLRVPYTNIKIKPFCSSLKQAKSLEFGSHQSLY